MAALLPLMSKIEERSRGGKKAMINFHSNDARDRVNGDHIV